LPEALLGIDLVTGARRELPRDTLAEAFDAAMEVNLTIDQPHGTAEAFLEAQARMIETTLGSAELAPGAAEALRRFRAVADGASVGSDDPELRRREGRYRGWAQGLAEAFPEIAETLVRGRFADLEALGAASRTPWEFRQSIEAGWVWMDFISIPQTVGVRSEQKYRVAQRDQAKAVRSIPYYIKNSGNFCLASMSKCLRSSKMASSTDLFTNVVDMPV
jgi:hypothetical protein